MNKERLTENINVRLTKGEKNLLKKTRDVFYSKKSVGWVVRELIKHHQKQFERMFDRSASEKEIEKKYQESLKEAKNETI